MMHTRVQLFLGAQILAMQVAHLETSDETLGVLQYCIFKNKIALPGFLFSFL